MAAADQSLNRRVVRSTVRPLAASALVLFVSAGTLAYWQAWMFLCLHSVSTIAVNLYMLRYDPELLRRRLAVEEQGETQLIHKLFVIFLLGLGIAQLVVAGLDRRYGWSQASPLVVVAAGLFFLVGAAIVFWVLRTNSHASSIITVEREQPVITHGPYRWVRHPMYTGFLSMLAALPLLLGSYRAEVFFLPLAALFVVRLLAEERFLRTELPGYAAYMNKTKRRLLPGMW
jgi:protein-S-isoprenylcysteine O-methyltransferase Ste14